MTSTTRKAGSKRTRPPSNPSASIAGVSRAVLVAYCESGVLPVSPAKLDACAGDDEMIRTIRRLEFLREHHGINLAGIRIIAELMREVERLREELRFRLGA